MRVTTYAEYDLASGELLRRESYEYDGAIAHCFGGGSKTQSSTTTSTDIDTTQVGIERVEGVGIASSGDVDFAQHITQTDYGAVERSLEYAGEFGERALDFAEDVARQAGQTSQQAVDISRRAVATVVTDGASDIAQSHTRSIAVLAAAAAAVLIASRRR